MVDLIGSTPKIRANHLIHLLHHYLLALVLWLDDRRIQTHLRRTEQRLRRQDTSALSPPLQIARSRHLDHLRRYWQQGRFPRHSDRPGPWSPCFIDQAGRTCAVAELLVTDGQEKLAQQVATSRLWCSLSGSRGGRYLSAPFQSGSNRSLAPADPRWAAPEWPVLPGQCGWSGECG